MEVDDYCMRYSTVHDRPSVCVVGKDCGQMGPARTVGWGTTGRMGMNKLITPRTQEASFIFYRFSSKHWTESASECSGPAESLVLIPIEWPL